jgi:hypothetical protein
LSDWIGGKEKERERERKRERERESEHLRERKTEREKGVTERRRGERRERRGRDFCCNLLSRKDAFSCTAVRRSTKPTLEALSRLPRVVGRVARWFIFKPKIPNGVNFLGPEIGKC